MFWLLDCNHYIGLLNPFLFHTFYCNVGRAENVFYQEYCYTEDHYIGVLLYQVN